MSAAGVTDALVEAIGSGAYDFIVANFANPDMVGHTGVWDATIAGLEVIDACLARIVAAVDAVDADDPAAPGAAAGHHRRPRQRRRAARRRGPRRDRPLAQSGAVRPRRAGRARPRARDGVLADVAPTLLDLAGLPRWAGMTGRSRIL